MRIEKKLNTKEKQDFGFERPLTHMSQQNGRIMIIR
jgi:hypothetical protein